MRLVIWLAALMCVASVSLAVVSAAHLPFHKQTTSDAVAFIDHRFIDRSKLTVQETKLLERQWSIVLGNESYLTATHGSLWRTAVFGFAGLSLASLVLTVLCVLHAKRGRRDVTVATTAA